MLGINIFLYLPLFPFTSASGDINDCYSQPCIQGTCVDGQNNFTCICPHLYNGTTCENDLSQFGCVVEPCLNGGTCINETDGSRNYRCDCVNGESFLFFIELFLA